MGASESLPAKLSALPEQWVDRIFGRMSAFYGTLFSDRWRDANLLDVKRVWAEELASFSDNPECFGKALKEMVACKFPPTLPEFVTMCRSHYKRPSAGPSLEHKLTDEDVTRNRDRAKQLAEQLARRLAA